MDELDEIEYIMQFSSPSGGDQFISNVEMKGVINVRLSFRLLLAEISLYLPIGVL